MQATLVAPRRLLAPLPLGVHGRETTVTGTVSTVLECRSKTRPLHPASQPTPKIKHEEAIHNKQHTAYVDYGIQGGATDNRAKGATDKARNKANCIAFGHSVNILLLLLLASSLPPFSRLRIIFRGLRQESPSQKKTQTNRKHKKAARDMLSRHNVPVIYNTVVANATFTENRDKQYYFIILQYHNFLYTDFLYLTA